VVFIFFVFHLLTRVRGEEAAAVAEKKILLS